MGPEIGIGEIPPMINCRVLTILGVIAALFLSRATLADHEPSRLSLEATHSSSADALTTEKIWILDPAETNPHRQRWLLQREVQLIGLAARPESASTVFGVTARGLRSRGTLYFRADGPGYRPLQEFPCEDQLSSQYANREGTAHAAEIAAQEWEKLLSEEKGSLEKLLSQVHSKDPAKAVLIAERFFQDWLAEVTLRWQGEGRNRAREKEWAFYRDSAKKLGVCKKNSLVSWERLMEAPAQGDFGMAGRPGDEMKVLARAPVKWVEGVPTIRLNLKALGRKLNGRFLVHTGVEHSAVSPDFLVAQGVTPGWLELENMAPRRVSWGGSPESPQGGLGKVVRVDQVELGNHLTTFHDFTLFDTELFSPPQVVMPCCDGVLGADFLKGHVVELTSTPAPELKLWAADGFHLAPELQAKWMEVYLSPSGELVSSCVLNEDRKQGSSSTQLFGATWDTSLAESIAIHLPFQKEVRASMGKRTLDSFGWKLNCQFPDQIPMAEGVGVSFPSRRDASTKSLLTRMPAFSLGTGFIKNFRVFFDLPHGRVWLVPHSAKGRRVSGRNSGLSVHFDLKGPQGARRLIVDSIQPGTPAQSLVTKGLRKGAVLLEIDGIPVETLNQGDVHERLSGTQGSDVRVVWSIPHGKQAGTLSFKD